ncbi:MAG TPA: antitoxin Xre-like helix-turn-helix domain-containing protein [Edaphobacter sp.]|jgi:uncharacterized protein (DUF2384 family)
MAAIAIPPALGYRFDTFPDFSDPATRERLSASALKGFFAITESWKLNPDQQSALLGGVPRSTLFKRKTQPTALSQDQLTRISYIIGVYKALNILLPKKYADAWMTTPNRNLIFGDLQPLQYAIKFGLPGLAEIRELLDAARGGR